MSKQEERYSASFKESCRLIRETNPDKKLTDASAVQTALTITPCQSKILAIPASLEEGKTQKDVMVAEERRLKDAATAIRDAFPNPQSFDEYSAEMARNLPESPGVRILSFQSAV